MSTQLFTAMLTVFVLGLFFGTNLGIALLCVMQMAGRQSAPSSDLVPVAARVDAKD